MNYIVGNWKSNKNLNEALTFLEELALLEEKNPVFNHNPHQLGIIATPYPFIERMQNKINTLGLNIKLAIQNISSFGPGAYTGEICAENLTDLGVEYVILGHSERRLHCAETNEQIAQKIERSLTAGIKPILCLDEPYIKAQAQAIDPSFYSQLIIAFEPLSAIGTGQSMRPAQVELTYSVIKEDFDSTIPLLYGGSVNPETVTDYLKIGQGVLVGSASLQAPSFQKLGATL